MGVMRNFINIEGITQTEELPNQDGQIVIFSEVETLFLPPGNPGIDTIFQIMVGLEMEGHHKLRTPIGTIVSVHGHKNIKVIYKGEEGDKGHLVTFTNPYNTFFELPEDRQDYQRVNGYIIDCYFSPLAKDKIYGYFLYLLAVQYGEEYDEEALEEAIIKKMRSLKANLLRGGNPDGPLSPKPVR